VPEPPTAAAERKRAVRDAGRRRSAVDVLTVASAVAGYAAREVGDGLGPEQARLAVVEAAAELEAAASSLRRLARLGPADRRALAANLAALGFTRAEIADRLGVSQRAVYGYLRSRS
jgi:DNA-directed RNA polymerase specialized sigma24 family protein